MLEQDIINLGFTKEYGENKSFYYYTLDVGSKETPLTLISPSNDEIVHEEWWYVEIFNHNGIKFIERDSLRDFIHILNNL